MLTSVRKLLPNTVSRSCNRQFWSRIKNLWLDQSDFEIAPISILNSSPYSSRVTKWRALSDKDYRGSSRCAVEVGDTGVVFTGEVIPPPVTNEEDKRRGFCAIKGNLDRVLDLRDYQGVEIALHSDVPIEVRVNMTCQSYIRDDLYQVSLEIDSNQEAKYFIPFHTFR